LLGFPGFILWGTRNCAQNKTFLADGSISKSKDATDIIWNDPLEILNEYAVQDSWPLADGKAKSA